MKTITILVHSLCLSKVKRPYASSCIYKTDHISKEKFAQTAIVIFGCRRFLKFFPGMIYMKFEVMKFIYVPANIGRSCIYLQPV